MSEILPDPQLMSDGNSLTVFAASVSQTTSKFVNALANGADINSPECTEFKAYFKQNLPKLKVNIERFEADLG